MKNVLKWTAIFIGGLIGLVLVTGLILYALGRTRSSKAPEFAAVTLPADNNASLVARGEHITNAIVGCAGCHGVGLKGKHFPIPGPIVNMAAPNLTKGKGGVGDNTPVQWQQALIGGIGRDGRSLMVMPSHAYARMSQTDLAALIAYLGTIPPVDNELPPRKLGPFGGIMVGAGIFPLETGRIAKTNPKPSTVPPGATKEYGHYLIELATCTECHGEDFQGTKGFGTVPPPSLRTKARTWTEEEFRNTLRTGRTPDGRALKGDEMPWPFYANMTDEELKAIWLYISSLAPHVEAKS